MVAHTIDPLTGRLSLNFGKPADPATRPHPMLAVPPAAPSTADTLRERLYDAVQANNAKMVDDVLRDIGAHVGPGRHFTTTFRNYTAVSGWLIDRVRRLGLKFWLGWDDATGHGEIRPTPERKPYKKAKLAPDKVHELAQRRAERVKNSPPRGENHGDTRTYMRGHVTD